MKYLAILSFILLSSCSPKSKSDSKEETCYLDDMDLVKVLKDLGHNTYYTERLNYHTFTNSYTVRTRYDFHVERYKQISCELYNAELKKSFAETIKAYEDKYYGCMERLRRFKTKEGKDGKASSSPAS